MPRINQLAKIVARQATLRFTCCHRHLSTNSSDGLKRYGSLADIVRGPPTQFGFGKIANLAESSIVGSSGQTVALATLTSASGEENLDTRKSASPSVASWLRQRCRQSSSFAPLTVDYRQRHHAVGKIPSNSNRSDNQRPTHAETLAGRAIDRALRPLLQPSNNDSMHISCSIQACPLIGSYGGYPVALALNAASVALRNKLQESVAAVYLSLDENGTVTVDPPTPDEDAIGGLLYAGTRDKAVMIEFSGHLEESKLEDLIQFAHECIQPLLGIQDETRRMLEENKSDDILDEDALREQLRLPMLVENGAANHSKITVPDASTDRDAAEKIFKDASQFCSKQLSSSALRLFGCTDDYSSNNTEKKESPRIYDASSNRLLSKAARGKRENIFREAVVMALEAFKSDTSYDLTFLDEDPSLVNELADAIHSELLKEALFVAASQHQRRADNRALGNGNGCTTIRPISLEVPALPNVVHGSSLFTRGETQVLCTVTLGPPSDGVAINDPFRRPGAVPEHEPTLSDELPVGSLRYLRTQEYLESDLNSKKVRADREQTGDSGTLKERKRAFLQYDFPAFSKGEVQTGPRGANRREIGHAALAEKAILPVLPSPGDFPYAIRMTSEVTSSNGSSSMASVCGATLALLDAGVPIMSPVAGLSVGLAKRKNDDENYQLLLDITGSEDHYGVMDCKIAGSHDKVTAIHMDVHEPLHRQILFDALKLAREARGVLLDEMEKQVAHSSGQTINNFTPRAELKPSAPRVEVVRFDPMRKKDLLGPGGAVIRQMENRFNVSLDLTQEGQCLLFGEDGEMVRKARAAVMDLVSDVEVGEIYEGTVIEVRDFGIIVELLRNKEGLCHVSELADRGDIKNHREGSMGLINSLVRVGQKIDVECISVDAVMGTIRLRPAKKGTLMKRA